MSELAVFCLLTYVFREKYNKFLVEMFRKKGETEEKTLRRCLDISGWLMLIWIVFTFIYTAFFYKSAEIAVRAEIAKMPLPLSCSISYYREATAFGAKIMEVENEDRGIKHLEKWLLKNGYIEKGNGWYQKGRYVVNKGIEVSPSRTYLLLNYDCDVFMFGFTKDIIHRTIDTKFYEREK